MPAKDPEARRAYSRAYYAAHREQLIAKAAAWQAEHPERAKATNKRWYDNRGKEYRERNAEATKAAQKRWYAAHPGQKAVGNRVQRLRRHFGLTIEMYEALVTAQNGVCALCKRPESHRSRHGEITRLAVDHDHVTGSIRALLCHACNVGIGSFLDDPALLRAAAEYVELHRIRG
jgi:hypothetical protein